MRLLIKIQNLSDVITNSSSEVFVVKTEKDVQKVKNKIEKYHNEHLWDGDLDSLPSDVKYVIGGDIIVEQIKNMLNNVSGCGGDISVYTWSDAYNSYCRYINKKCSPEKWAAIFNIELDDIKKTLYVDVDWQCKATINFLQDEFNVLDYNEKQKVDELFSYCFL